MFEIKVGMLVSYDYKYLYHSLPLVYHNADKIILAIDKDRLTWSGLSYTIDNSFFGWLTEFDVQKKITIYEDTFYQPNLTTTECDTRERNMLAKKMGDGGWHIQIDSDEYFLDFNGYVNFLRSLETQANKTPIYVYTKFITIFKKLDAGYLYITNSYETIPVATNCPEYDYIRLVHKTKAIYTNFLVVHQSWARPNEEIEFKVKSWGHSNDFNVLSYFKMWKAIDENNFKYLSNFHPITPAKWSSLSYIQKTEIPEVLSYLAQLTIAPRIKKNIAFRILKKLNRIFCK